MKSIKQIAIRVTRTKLAEPHEVYSAKVTCPEVIAKVAQSILQGEDQEVFLTFFLTPGHKISGYQETHRGTLDGCPVDPRDVFRAAIIQGCAAIIVCHNHPSGDSTPSTEDIALTKRLKKAGDILGMPVLDHVVVTDDKYSSLAEMGAL